MALLAIHPADSRRRQLATGTSSSKRAGTQWSAPANRVGRREVLIGGIVHGLKSGGRDAPAVYGPRKTLYNRFVRWAAKGVCTDVFHALASAGGPPAELLIDSSAVTA